MCVARGAWLRAVCALSQVPDVRIMAEVFESLGADFRVLLLLRNVNDTLLSTVKCCSCSCFITYTGSTCPAAPLLCSDKRRATPLSRCGGQVQHTKYWGTMAAAAAAYASLVQADLLRNQLGRLDRRFLACFDYDTLPCVDPGASRRARV